MTEASRRKAAKSRFLVKSARVGWALGSVLVIESLVFGIAVLPAALFWQWSFSWEIPAEWVRIVVLSISFLPAYLIFAGSLVVLSALATRLTGWRTPVRVETPLVALDWPLLNWVRYMVSVHLVHIFVGTLFRGTPVWPFYMRLNGARLGRRVHINSLNVNDHNLLDFGDDVVIGGDAHLSGHTIENGMLRTAPVRLQRNVTIGVGAVVGIGVEAGAGCQVGALAMVPKFSKLEAGGIYVGIPVRKLERDEPESKAC